MTASVAIASRNTTRQTTFYIGSGAKNAMYTLRVFHVLNGYYNDHYICNLATDAVRAETKAREYFDRVAPRFESAQFGGEPDFNLFERRAKLSVRDTQSIALVESGYFPFGKFANEPIADAADSYVLWWADKAKDVSESNTVIFALANTCLGVALDRDLIAKREVIKAERLLVDAQSCFIGSIGDRIQVQGEVIGAFFKQSDYGDYFITKIRTADNNILTYIGKQLAAKGEVIKGAFTVKDHNEYQGVKSTLVNRPAKVSVV